MKKVGIIGGGIVVVIIIAVVVLWSNVGSIIKAAVEKFGSDILQAKVTLSSADISATSGEGSLKGLVVGNPTGFKTPDAFKLGSVQVTVDTGTISSDTIVIKQIVVNAPEVTYEFGQGGSNLETLKKNAEAYAGGGGASSSSSSSEGGGKKLVIDSLVIKGAKMNVSAPFFNGKTFGATLPEIHLTDIGKKEGGAGPGEIADKVVSAITSAATKTLGTIDFGGMAGQVKDQLSNIGGAAGAAAQSIMQKATEGASGAGSAAGDAVKKATEGLGGATDAVKGLFGGKK